MSAQDVENEAHNIYKANGCRFHNLNVINEVKSKHPKWTLHDTTQYQ